MSPSTSVRHLALPLPPRRHAHPGWGVCVWSGIRPLDGCRHYGGRPPSLILVHPVVPSGHSPLLARTRCLFRPLHGSSTRWFIAEGCLPTLLTQNQSRLPIPPGRTPQSPSPSPFPTSPLLAHSPTPEDPSHHPFHLVPLPIPQLPIPSTHAHVPTHPGFARYPQTELFPYFTHTACPPTPTSPDIVQRAALPPPGSTPDLSPAWPRTLTHPSHTPHPFPGSPPF